MANVVHLEYIHTTHIHTIDSDKY